MVASNIVYFDNNIVKGVSNLKLYDFINFNLFISTVGLPHPTWMVRSNFYKNFNYDRKIAHAQDQELLFRAYNSSKFALLKEPLLFYKKPERINVKKKNKPTLFIVSI